MFSSSAMRIISWNVRGINASDKRHIIEQQLDSSQVDIILLQETKLYQDSYKKLVGKWSNWKSSHARGVEASVGLTALWNPKTVQSSY